jgi:beta-phosphoglucomutase-like phosphatase (HAD superfamily)
MQSLNASPKSCLVFEDSTAGITSARAAECWVVAITETNHFNQDLSLAHHHIPNLLDINPEWVKNFSFRLRE